MTIYRNPVPGAAIPPPLACVGTACQNARNSHNKRAFTCPGKCHKGTFAYPRFLRNHNTPEASFHYHQGIDIGNTIGQKIVSVVNGTVIHVNHTYEWEGYGKVVIVEASDGPRAGHKFFHAHCDDVLVAEGDKVFEQDEIALVGNTWFDSEDEDSRFKDSAAHLHFEVYPGELPFSNKAKARPRPENAPRTAGHEVDPEGNNSDLRLNPLEVLEELGPYGGRQLYFPGGLDGDGKVNEAGRDALLAATEAGRGGFFPMGANTRWHGGLHVPVKPGSPVLSPFTGEIVAARLSSEPKLVELGQGSVNFILLRHEVPMAALRELSEEASSEQEQANAKDTRKRRVGRGIADGKLGDNEPEDVKKVRERLNAHGYRAGDAGNGTADETLFDAIGAFLKQRADKQGLAEADPAYDKVVDGFISLPGKPGYAWAELESPTAAEQAAADTESEPEDEPEASTLYSLLMHLAPRKIDATLAKKAKWLTRVEVPETDAERAEREQREAEEAARAQRDAAARAADEAEAAEHMLDIRHYVGVEGDPSFDSAWQRFKSSATVNDPEDVEWVKKRLKTYGFYSGPIDGSAPDESVKTAIEAFQQHIGNEHPDGWIVGRRATAGELAKTKHEREAAAAAAGESDEGAKLARLAERANEVDGDTAKVLDIQCMVQAGETLWFAGNAPVFPAEDADAGAPDSTGTQPPLGPVLHWELFSEKNLTDKLDGWTAVESDQDLDHLMEAPELVALAGGDSMLDADDILAFYADPAKAGAVRQYACKFQSEWALDAKEMVQAEQARHGASWDVDTIAKAIAPYMWWPKVQAPLPEPIVWHYNPVSFLSAYQSKLPEDKPKTAAADGSAASAAGRDADHSDKPWETWIRRRSSANTVAIYDWQGERNIKGVYTGGDAEARARSEAQGGSCWEKAGNWEALLRRGTAATGVRLYKGGIIAAYRPEDETEAKAEAESGQGVWRKTW